VSLESAAGVITTETVTERKSYVFLVTPGTYTLFVGRPGLCSGSAVVTAGKVTHADTVCPVP
jgi:hypothetical protein